MRFDLDRASVKHGIRSAMPAYTERSSLFHEIVDIYTGVVRTADDLGAIGRILQGEDREAVRLWL